jgi:hypothetical protein
MIRSSAVADQPVSADEVSAQTVVVYQTGTGKQLLRADCSPVERAGQNFALSPDGLALAAVHANAIEIYNLPPLTTKDESDLKLARSIAPPENDLPIRFGDQTAGGADRSDAQSEAQPDAQPAASASSTSTAPDLQPALPATHEAPATTLEAEQPEVKSSTSVTPPAAQPTARPETQGDPTPGQHRAPPTIYTLPDDKPTDKPAAKPKDTPQ